MYGSVRGKQASLSLRKKERCSRVCLLDESMLSINNTEHREKMKQYHRTRDMINLLLYFPHVSPIKDLIIIESVQDYLKNCYH